MLKSLYTEGYDGGSFLEFFKFFGRNEKSDLIIKKRCGGKLYLHGSIGGTETFINISESKMGSFITACCSFQNGLCVFDIKSCSVIRNGKGKKVLIQRNINVDHGGNGKGTAASDLKSMFQRIFCQWLKNTLYNFWRK